MFSLEYTNNILNTICWTYNDEHWELKPWKDISCTTTYLLWYINHAFNMVSIIIGIWKKRFNSGLYCIFVYPRYEVYRGYIVFAFSVIMFVCLFVWLLFFFVKDFSATTWVRILKFGTRLDSDELYCVTKEQPHIAYQSLYLFIFLSLQWKNLSSKISQQLLGLGFWNLVQSLIVMSCIV